MEEKICRAIANEARQRLDNSGEVGAFIGRLVDELDTGFCDGRLCEGCPVRMVMTGATGIVLTGREMVVNILSTNLNDRLRPRQEA